MVANSSLTKEPVRVRDTLQNTSVAQLAELAALNREVVGSSPTGGTIKSKETPASTWNRTNPEQLSGRTTAPVGARKRSVRGSFGVTDGIIITPLFAPVV